MLFSYNKRLLVTGDDVVGSIDGILGGCTIGSIVGFIVGSIVGYTVCLIVGCTVSSIVGWCLFAHTNVAESTQRSSLLQQYGS